MVRKMAIMTRASYIHSVAILAHPQNLAMRESNPADEDILHDGIFFIGGAMRSLCIGF
jgi:hypothetical protein